MAPTFVESGHQTQSSGAPSCFLLGRTPSQPEVPHGRDSPASLIPGGALEPFICLETTWGFQLPSELLSELSCSQAFCGDGGHPQAALSPRNIQAYEPHRGLAAEPVGKVPLGSTHPQLPGARQETGGCQLALWSLGEPVSVPWECLGSWTQGGGAGH